MNDAIEISGLVLRLAYIALGALAVGLAWLFMAAHNATKNKP